MTKLTIDIKGSTLDGIIVEELKDAIKFCEHHNLDDFSVAMEKTIQFYMTSADYYDWVALREAQK